MTALRETVLAGLLVLLGGCTGARRPAASSAPQAALPTPSHDAAQRANREDQAADPCHAADNQSVARDLDPPQDRFTALVVARQVIDIKAERSATIKALRVALGDQVAKGEIIAELEDTALRLELVRLQAALERARVDKELAELRLEQAQDRRTRIDSLSDVVSRERTQEAAYDEQIARVAARKAAVAVNEQEIALEQTQAVIDHSVIRSPCRAVVDIVFHGCGELVEAHENLVRIITADDLLVRFAVPRNETSDLEKGTPIVFLPAQDETARRAFCPGRVEAVAPSIDPALDVTLVVARLDAPEARPAWLKPGAQGNVERGAAPRAKTRP